MFNSLYGTITHKDEEAVHLLTGGVEWDVAISARSSRNLPAVGGEARIFIHLYHREDTMKLFGFAGEDERALFYDLMKVQGIGPKQAMKILSGMDVEEFIAHLEAGDADSMTHINGLGKKTAQKIILTLKGKLSIGTDEDKPAFQDVVSALADMGYDRKDCAAVIQKILKDSDFEAVPEKEREKELFRRAIVALSS